jgi:hypothetical protein
LHTEKIECHAQSTGVLLSIACQVAKESVEWTDIPKRQIKWQPRELLASATSRDIGDDGGREVDMWVMALLGGVAWLMNRASALLPTSPWMAVVVCHNRPRPFHQTDVIVLILPTDEEDPGVLRKGFHLSCNFHIVTSGFARDVDGKQARGAAQGTSAW